MKRIYAAIAFLLLALVISISGYFILTARINLLNDSLGKASYVAEKKDGKKIGAQTEKVYCLWEDNIQVLSSILMHADIDKLDINMHKLQYYSKEKDYKHYAETCEESISYLKQIIESEKLNYGNVL